MDNIRTNAFYERDEYSWLQQQIDILRTGQLDAVDREHLIEFLEDMKARVEREIGKRFKTLLTHMLKFECQPTKATRSWVATILNQQDEIEDEVISNPGVKQELPRLYEKAYPRAVKLAVAETGLEKSVFPPTNPWTLDEALRYEPPDPADLNPTLQH